MITRKRDTTVLENTALFETVKVKHPHNVIINLECAVVQTDLYPILTIKYSDPKQSVVASLAYFIPQLISYFQLDIIKLRVVFLSISKAENSEVQDLRYLEVDFAREIQRQEYKGDILSYVLLKSPATISLPADIAYELELAGIELSQYHGRQVLLRTVTDGDIKGVVEYYDGERYYLKTGKNEPLKVFRGIIRKSY